jgi:hypothetical protein
MTTESSRPAIGVIGLGIMGGLYAPSSGGRIHCLWLRRIRGTAAKFSPSRRPCRRIGDRGRRALGRGPDRAESIAAFDSVLLWRPVACGLFFGVAFMFLLRDEGEGIDSPRDDGQRKVSHVVNLLDAH